MKKNTNQGPMPASHEATSRGPGGSNASAQYASRTSQS
jgi:hypothetical protein